jgi:hypothetical protein
MFVAQIAHHANYKLVGHKEVGLLSINAINVKIAVRGLDQLSLKKLVKIL